MKWLQANPVGMVLAATGGFFLLLMLIMTIVWNLPVSVEVDETGSENISDQDRAVTVANVGPLREYEVINERPVFNESRLPLIDEDDDELLQEGSDTAIAVADAPDVRLTGIIITPDLRLASLTPADRKIEPVMAHEGESLTGEFLGWEVSTVNPRHVVLESRDGQTVQLELEVHDKKITEPPKLVVPDKDAIAKAAADASPAQNPADSSGEEPLSRAEQIRQRIAERREELRRQQEEQQPNSGRSSGSNSTTNSTSAYQNAMRDKIRNQSKDKSSDNNDDG